MITTKERTLPTANETAIIRLKGHPYRQEKDGQVLDCTDTLERLVLNTDYETRLSESIANHESDLTPLFGGGYYGIDAKIKKGISLSYEEAFSLMSFVSMGVNQAVYRQLQPRLPEGMPTDPDTIFYQSIALLSAMSAKEGFVGLTPEEIAGLTAATLEIDTIVRVPASQTVFAMGGMGGDRGYPKNGNNSKLFSLSTLSAIVLANLGLVHKHHSYPNTSKVAGQSAIETFGAKSNQDSLEEFQNLQEATSLLMSSCHTTRLIHTLSHRLKGETINHIVGPLSIPVDSQTEACAIIGVNDNVHPETVIEALRILHQKGIQNYGNSVAFCGLNTDSPTAEHLSPQLYYRSSDTRETVALDEVAPPPYSTLASFLVNGQNLGTFVIQPEDFMIDARSVIHYKELLIPNQFDDIMSANAEAISGDTISSKSLYLGMTGAVALFARDYAHLPNAFDFVNRRLNPKYLRMAHHTVMEIISSGQAKSKLREYIDATK